MSVISSNACEACICCCLYSHETSHTLPQVDESGWQLNSDISFEYKWSICNIIPHEMVEILRKIPLQEDTEDDHEGVELLNLANIFFDKDSIEISMIIMTSYPHW